MLNPFPIQWLALLAYFILRLFVGLTLLIITRQHIRHYRDLVDSTHWPLFPAKAFPIQMLIFFELIIALLLIIGAWTQYAALLLIGMSIKMLIWRNRFSHSSIPPRIIYVLLLGSALSLFITGAGAFAFDLPI